MCVFVRYRSFVRGRGSLCETDRWFVCVRERDRKRGSLCEADFVCVKFVREFSYVRETLTLIIL